MTTAKRRALDRLRQRELHARKEGELIHEIESLHADNTPDLDALLDAAKEDEIGDDLLRLVFIACHPVLSTDARVALTLRLLGGLTTDEIARAFLVPEATIAQRIVRAKRTLAEARVPFEVPRGGELRRAARVGAGGALSRLQRRLLGHGRRRLDAAGAVRGRAAARPDPGGAGAAGARGARPGGADGDPGVAAGGPRRTGRRTGPAARPEPRALGPAADPPRPRGARARRSAGRHARALRAAGRDRRLPRARHAPPTRPIGRASPRCTTRWRRSCRRRWSS